MNKKTIVTFALIIAFSFLGNVNVSNAATESNILPNNPFYFFKDLGRQIQDFLTFAPTEKVELRLKVAEEKLAEIEKIAETNPNSVNYVKYLSGYEAAVEKVKEKIDTLDAQNTEVVLNNITSNLINQGVRLEELKNTVRSEDADAINQIKNRVVNEYTNTSLKIASEEKVQNQIENVIGQMSEERASDVIQRMGSSAPENLKNILEKMEVFQRLQTQLDSSDSLEKIINDNDLINKVHQETERLGLTTDEIVSEVNTFSEEDLAKLKQYALEVLVSNNSQKNTSLDQINLSEDALSKISNLKDLANNRIGEASEYCLNQGNKVLQENGVTFCISPKNERCEIIKFLNKTCLFK